MVKKINESGMDTYYDRYGCKRDLDSEYWLHSWIKDAISEIKNDCSRMYHRKDKGFSRADIDAEFWNNLADDIMQKIKDHYASDELYQFPDGYFD